MYPDKKPPKEKPVCPPTPPVCPPPTPPISPPKPPVCPPKPPQCCRPQPSPCCQQEYSCHPQMMFYCQPQPMLYCERQSAYPPPMEGYEEYDSYAYVPYGSEPMYGYQGNSMPMYDPAYRGHYGGNFGPAAGDTISAGEPRGVPYVVKQGDTICSIAQTHGVMWQDLLNYNHLHNPQELYVGQHLLIPSPGY